MIEWLGDLVIEWASERVIKWASDWSVWSSDEMVEWSGFIHLLNDAWIGEWKREEKLDNDLYSIDRIKALASEMVEDKS